MKASNQPSDTSDIEVPPHYISAAESATSSTSDAQSKVTAKAKAKLEQNRINQQQFRRRQKTQIQTLQQQVNHLTIDKGQLLQHIECLENENILLQSALAARNCYPPPSFPYSTNVASPKAQAPPPPPPMLRLPGRSFCMQAPPVGTVAPQNSSLASLDVDALVLPSLPTFNPQQQLASVEQQQLTSVESLAAHAAEEWLPITQQHSHDPWMGVEDLATNRGHHL